VTCTNVERVYVLGIDPGLTRCGYACIDATSRRAPVAAALGVITTPVDATTPMRLAELRRELQQLIAELRPQVVVVEHVFFQLNRRTAMSVAQASGLALAEAAASGAQVVQYTANQVKLTLTGYGAATKVQIQKMVQTRLSLSTLPRPADAADAAALALCHLAMTPMADRVAAARSRSGHG
jgi:crossover junction endodeoxyribonuclease RuvC